MSTIIKNNSELINHEAAISQLSYDSLLSIILNYCVSMITNHEVLFSNDYHY